MSARKVDDCLMELRWRYDRWNPEEASQDVTAWLAERGKRYPVLCSWVEDSIEETLSFYRFPRQRSKNLKCTNMLERLSKREIRDFRHAQSNTGIPRHTHRFAVRSDRSPNRSWIIQQMRR